ncbi:MAG: YheC/YheD family protein [Oscillospiraceae bacterium]|nr:YheC/YheD family protein [Oscillospiraceae bacterium]
MSKENRRLKASFLEKMMVYVKKYSELHGAVVVFALDRIDIDKQIIEGYCYNPIENRFEKGTFPYPCAIYRTIGLNGTWKDHFRVAIGDKLFNSQYFSKWKMHQWLSVDTEINDHIPYTVLYKSEQDIFDMLETFKKIYVKPISGLRGKGIFQVSKDNALYVFKHRDNGSNLTDTFETKSEASEYIKNILANGKYIVQQAINLMNHEGSIIDFRCIMQKDQSNSWKCNAIIAKCSGTSSIVSNISNGGTAFDAEFMFKEVLHLSDYKSAYILNEIKSFAFHSCNKLDELGINCGTLGLDVGMDTNDYVWLIEINNRDPDPTIALDINDVKLYYELKTNPLFYAKALAGFKSF